MKLYHVDRYKMLKDGQRIELLPLTILPEDIQKSRLLCDFKNGISYHGKNYLEDSSPDIPFEKGELKIAPESIQKGKQKLDASVMELTLEIVRRSCFPTKKSRLTSFFALSDFRNWEFLLDKNENPDRRLFELNVPDDTPRYDAAWLKFGTHFQYDETYWWMGMDIARGYDMAYAYWSGESTASPQYEYLVQLPIAQIHLVHAF